MTYVIAGSCIKDDSCVEVCPVDCIHPKPGAPDFETAEQLYIDPEVCIDCDACVDACPVDCIHPKPGAPDFEVAEQLYIDPGVCIDCDACVEVCPVDAIFADFELPERHAHALDLNARFFAEQSTAERTAL